MGRLEGKAAIVTGGGRGGGGGGAGAFTAGGGKDYSRTVADLLASLLKEFKGEKNRREKANKELERILKQATKNMERTMKQMVRGMVQSAKEALKEAKRAYRERVSSIKQGVAGFASITRTGGTEYVSGAGLLEEMRARMNLAKTFQSQYGQLDKLGLNAKSLKEIVNLGPQEGARIAGALLEGSGGEVKARIAEVNYRTSHLVDGTMMNTYLKQHKLKLQEAKDSIAFYLQGEDSGLEFKEELTKMLKQ